MDRVPGYEPGGRGFESCRARHLVSKLNRIYKLELISTPEKIICIAVPLIFAITLHEAAHGYIANLFGDSTAKKLGRITINPIPHIDIFGTILIPLVLFFISKGSFSFGYAKPVPVNFNNLLRPKLHMVYVALAGPLANFIQAIIWSLIFVILEIIYPIDLSLIKQICKFGILINILLFVVNLFPIPPLDGGRVIVGLLPDNVSKVFSKIEPFGFALVVLLLLAGLMNEFWIKPLMNLVYMSLDLFTYPITFIFN